MFVDIKNDSSSRLLEVRTFLDFIKDETPKPPTPAHPSLITAKGLFFVHLYGAFEFTVTSAVAKAIEIINSKSHNVNECKPLLMSLALHAECDALFSATDKRWEKRWHLFSHFQNNSIVQISSDLLPTNGRNLQYRQLESIWKSFCISESVLPRNEIGGRVQELVNNRNAIAHGTRSASEIGSLNSIDDLYIKYRDISELCSYIIDILENHITHKKYLQ